MDVDQGGNQLKRTMKSRHLFMISLGGVIGTGLFLSTGYTLSQAGTGGTIAAYLIGGLMMYLVMQCLGELSVAMPVTGSFQTYATTFIEAVHGLYGRYHVLGELGGDGRIGVYSFRYPYAALVSPQQRLDVERDFRGSPFCRQCILR